MVAPQTESNPEPPAPLGSAPAPRAPVLPPLNAPLPLTPAPPGSLCSGSVAGSGGVATQRGTAALRVVRQSRSSTSAAPAPTAASPWRRAAASRRTARRSLAVCPRIGTTFCRRASTWPCARSWGAILSRAPRTWIVRGCASSLCFPPFFVVATRIKSLVSPTFGGFHLPFFLLLLPFGSFLKDSNPQPPAPLAALPPPRAPLVGSHRSSAVPHACGCATRLAVLRVCFWDWRCGGSTWRCCEQPPCVAECIEKTVKCCCPCCDLML